MLRLWGGGGAVLQVLNKETGVKITSIGIDPSKDTSLKHLIEKVKLKLKNKADKVTFYLSQDSANEASGEDLNKAYN